MLPDGLGLDPDPGAVRRAAHDILSRPEFQPPYESPIDRLRHWVGQQIARVLDAAFSGRVTLLGAVVLGAIAVLVVYLGVRAVRGVTRDPAARGVVFDGPRRPPADWLAEALACEQRADWRGALRARYRALVAELARRGLVEEVAGRTAGEYRRAVEASLPRSAEEFGGATELFELVVYGDGTSGPPESARLEELSARVLAGAR